ncbi:Uma2 family endonuclease [Methylobacterium sp. WSM2598]|uniref:Uma2 family endonuclease n=1 Tax=Methylobacterium sp. WSM2598 TaxID=398261 RepID=UPI0003A49076|nr:Uma2 family endonuclease [Methylobacterium sp. WSM2598]
MRETERAAKTIEPPRPSSCQDHRAAKTIHVPPGREDPALRRFSAEDLRRPEILLVIEVAASSLAYDLGRKARLYARSGIAESWVIAAQERQARVHRGPRGEAGYAEIRDHGPDSVLVPRADLLAGVTVPLADLV